MENPPVSVIIPVYNCEKYIKRCIDSLLEQTYKNIEIIVVDDGSTDRSGAICQNFSGNNLIYVRQENAGPSVARNKGLSLMKGEYVTFVDADDYVPSNYIQELLKLIWKYDVQIATCSYIKKNNMEINKKEKSVALKEMVLSSNDALKSLFYKREITAYAHLKMYHASVIYNQSFPERLRLGEDLQFIYEALKKVDKVAYSNQELYYYCQNEMSITHNFNCDVAEAHWCQLKNLLNAAEDQVKEAIISRMFIVAYDFLCMMSRETNKSFRKELIKFIKDNKVRVLLNRENKLIVQCMALASFFSASVLIWLCKKTKRLTSRGIIILKKAI